MTGKLTRSETVTVRLDPRLRYLAELAARVQRRTLSSYIEWAVKTSTKEEKKMDQALVPTVTDIAALLDANTKTYSRGLVDGSLTERRALCREIEPAIEEIRLCLIGLTLNAPGDEEWSRDAAKRLMTAYAILTALD